MFATHRRLSLAALCLVALLPSASVAALIVPVSQTRSVSAEASHPLGTPSSDSESAPDFGPFVGSASATSWYFTDRVAAGIEQQSTIGPDRIDLTVDGAAYFGLYGGTASAASIFDVTFDLTVESEYWLWHEGDSTFFANVGGTLSGPEGVIANLYGYTSYEGVLAPGRYRLQAFATGVQAPDSYEGRIYQQIFLDLTPIPEPSTALLLVSGLVALAVNRVRRNPQPGRHRSAA